MFNKFIVITAMSLLSLTVVSCDRDTITEAKKITEKKETVVVSSNNSNKRWYTSLQVASGRKVFKNNCAVCHGDQGQGIVADWKKTLANGTYPPPPLNGSAHTWHHSKDQLLRTINTGGVPLGGSMPAFKDKLTAKEKEAVMAYFMSLWSERIYKAWEQRNAG